MRRGTLFVVLCALTLSLIAMNAQPVAAAPGFQAVPLEAVPFVERLDGDDRYGTSVAVSRAGWPDGSDYVVIATGEDFADSAVSAPLAAAHDAPLLLTRSSGLPDAVRAELRRLNAKHAVIVGGTAAVRDAVERQIRGLGVTDVKRIGGGDRYETAAAVALHVSGLQERTWGVVVATGIDHADSVSVSGLASALQTPLLLTRPDSLPPSTAAAIRSIGPLGTLIVGSEAAVSSAVESRLDRVRRVGGADRYATAIAVAGLAEEAGFTPATLVVASGVSFPDATVSGPLAASLRAPMVLVKPASLPEATRTWVEARCSQVERIRVVGGPPAVSESTVAALREATVTRMNPRARIADAALASMVTTVAADGSSITFSAWTEALRSLAPGDILVFDPSETVPEGFLGTVVRVDEQDGAVVVQASEASLADVFEKAGVSYIVRSGEETSGAGALGAAALGSAAPAGFFEDVGDWISSGASALYDTFVSSGESMWDLVYLLATGDYEEGFTAEDDFIWQSPEVSFDDGGKHIGSAVLRIWSSPTVRFGVLIEDYSLEYCGLYAFDYPIARLAANIVSEGSGSRRLYTRDLGTKHVKVGAIRVPFHNYLHVDCGMDVYETQGVNGLKIGEASAIVELEAYVDGGGFNYGTARSGLDFFTIPSAGDAFVDPAARFEGREDFDVWMGVRLESLAYDAAGPFVDARAIMNTEVDPTASSADGAWRTVTAKLRADLGLHLKKIVDYEKTVTGIDLGSRVVHQDRGPFPAHKIALARPVGDDQIRVRLDGPGEVDATTVSAADFFSLPGLTFISAVHQGGGEFLLTCAQDIGRTGVYDVYLKAGSVANTDGILNTEQSAAGFDCARIPQAFAHWISHDTLYVSYGAENGPGSGYLEDPAPSVVVTRLGTPVPVASVAWSDDAIHLGRFLVVKLAQPFQTEPWLGEYAVGLSAAAVRDADGYQSFAEVADVSPRYHGLIPDPAQAIDYSHVDITFTNNFGMTTDIRTADPARFAVTGEHAVSVIGAQVLADGATVRLTTTKMPHTAEPWLVILRSGAVTDGTGRSNFLTTRQFTGTPRATLACASPVDATHADLVFEGFGTIVSASAGGIKVDGTAVTEAVVLTTDTVRIATPVQHLGETYSVTVAEGAVTDAAGIENASGAADLAAFPSPEMRSAWATNQNTVRLDFDIAPEEILETASLDLSAFTLDSDATTLPASIVDVTVGRDCRSVSVVTSGTTPFTAYRVRVGAGAVADTSGRPCVAAEISYEYSPPLISQAEALGPRSVLLRLDVAPDRPIDPATVQPFDFTVARVGTGEESTPAAASVVGDARGIVLTLSEETSATSVYMVSSKADSFADTAGTWNRDTQAPFSGYDLSLTVRSLPVSPGHDVSHLVVDDGGALFAEHIEGHSPGDTDALAWWRPGTALPFGVLAGGGEAGPWYAHSLAALDATRALVPATSGSELYVWSGADAVSGPIELQMPASQMPFPFHADHGTVVYGGMFGGVAMVDTYGWTQTQIVPDLLPEWPTISGNRVACTSRHEGIRYVWVIGEPWDLNYVNVASADLDQPIASVSGTKVAYIRGGDVFVYDFTPGVYQEMRITETPQLESRAVLSGDLIVFERRDAAGSESSVHLIEMGSGFEKPLSEGLTDARLPWISGDTVGFVATGTRDREVWLLDVSGP